jgi:hypothetical protein
MKKLKLKYLKSKFFKKLKNKTLRFKNLWSFIFLYKFNIDKFNGNLL